MLLKDYIDPEALAKEVADDYVNEQHHRDFPLVLYSYSKKNVLAYRWNAVTTRTRGLIVNNITGEVVARPFEKWFNLGEQAFPEYHRENLPEGQPIVQDKIDGNLITLYPFNGRWYAASKGSFHSEHADWANSQLRQPGDWPLGYTPVLEMINEDIDHHVVHYGKELYGLYLLALICIETGEEMSGVQLIYWARKNDIVPVAPIKVMLDRVLTDNDKNAEGYVLSWARGERTPFKVKVKFVDFLRLQKLVRGTGPKEILDYLRKPELKCYLNEALDPERSHSEFAALAKIWVKRLRDEHTKVADAAGKIWNDHLANFHGRHPSRGMVAEYFRHPDRVRYAAILFAWLDGNKTKADKAIWKLVEPIVEGATLHMEAK